MEIIDGKLISAQVTCRSCLQLIRVRVKPQHNNRISVSFLFRMPIATAERTVVFEAHCEQGTAFYEEADFD